MKMLLRIRKPLSLLLCAALLMGLCACSLDGLKASGKKSAAGVDFLKLDDPTRISSITVEYTHTIDGTTVKTVNNAETIADFCTAAAEAVGGKKSVEWNEMTDKVDGGEGYLFTLKFTDGTTAILGFLLNPTKGYLTMTVNGGETVYFQVGETALKNLKSFYPA